MDGVLVLKSRSIVVGAKTHWYSTEQILKYKKYNKLIIEVGFIEKIQTNIALNIRYINKRICDSYLIPSLNFRNRILKNFKRRFRLSISEIYASTHLRIGDADKQPFKKYINKSEISNVIKLLKIYDKRMILLSDSIYIKKYIKKEIGNNIYTDYNPPCHSRNSVCLDESMEDIMMMINSNFLILTRGSTFSLFGSYLSKCKNDNIVFVGHNYDHINYFS